MKIICVIPSRLHSSRLPRKPLLDIKNKPMIQHVYERAQASLAFSQVIVATDSEEIAKVIRTIGGDAALTDAALPTGTDRVAAVAEALHEADVIVNLQGDQPFVTTAMLHQLIAPYVAGKSVEMATLAAPLQRAHYQQPSAVKVMTNRKQEALYFSRAPIPYSHEAMQTLPVYHHIGLYAYTREFLQHYRTLPQTPLEQIESLEQLRALEHGHAIYVSLTDSVPLEVNTPEDYQAAQDYLIG